MTKKQFENSNKDTLEGKIKLHEERLDISKNRVKNSEVTFHTEKVVTEKTITVPVIKEELVIETTTLDENSGNYSNIAPKITRIPLSEEHIEINKHPVKVNDVNIYKHNIEDTVHVEETLRVEKLNIQKDGNIKVIDMDNGID